MMDNPQLIDMLRNVQHLPSCFKEEHLVEMGKEVREKLFEAFNSCADDVFLTNVGQDKSDLKKLYDDEITLYEGICKLYAKGNICEAMQKMKDLLKSNKSISKKGYSKSDGLLFRVRGNDKYQLFDREEMFHMPLDQTSLIGNQRYSINGFPCLYLGASIYDCWEETRRPDLEKLNVVAYKYVKAKPMEFLLIDYPKRAKELACYKNVVLFLFCSYFSKRDDDKHKDEYVIPELVLHALINMRESENWDFDGVAYISSRFFKASCFFPSNHDLMLNYVIPIKGEQSIEVGDKHNRYCADLAGKFKLSDTMALFTEKVKGRDFPKIHPRPTGYVNSLFYQMEQEFKGSSFEFIKGVVKL